MTDKRSKADELLDEVFEIKQKIDALKKEGRPIENGFIEISPKHMKIDGFWDLVQFYRDIDTMCMGLRMHNKNLWVCLGDKNHIGNCFGIEPQTDKGIQQGLEPSGE